MLVTYTYNTYYKPSLLAGIAKASERYTDSLVISILKGILSKKCVVAPVEQQKQEAQDEEMPEQTQQQQAQDEEMPQQVQQHTAEQQT